MQWSSGEKEAGHAMHLCEGIVGGSLSLQTITPYQISRQYTFITGDADVKDQFRSQ